MVEGELPRAIWQSSFSGKKVEMQYLHGEIEAEAKLIGTEAHEKLLAKIKLCSTMKSIKE